MSFPASRWAEAFLQAAADDWEAGFSVLEALICASENASGYFSGLECAEKARLFFLRSLEKAAIGKTRGVRAAISAFSLLIARGYFSRRFAFLAAVRETADERQGILDAHLETAAAPDAAFLENLKTALTGSAGAKDARFLTRVEPGLIAGCRVTIGGERRDFSLRGRARQLEQKLAGLEPASGAGG